MGVGPTSSAWKADIIATIRHPRFVSSFLSASFLSVNSFSVPSALPQGELEFILSELLFAKGGLSVNTFGEPGFEPGINPPKGLVLPLHYSPLFLIRQEAHILYTPYFNISKIYYYSQFMV